MSSTLASDEIVHGYSVLRVTVDDARGDTVPVGVAAWDRARGWFGTRVVERDERVRGVPKWARDFLDVTLGQLHRWAEEEVVPYEPGRVAPSTGRFWRAASEILSTSVRLDPPKAMDPMDDPGHELEALFEAVVQPRQGDRRRRERVDGALSRALGDLASELQAGPELDAFGQARERVRKAVVVDRGMLLVDGVNLAASQARRDADALVSRFWRIRAAYADRPVSIVIGYLASRGGLNGEAHMRDWIRAKLTPHVFDLSTESRQLRAAAREAGESLGLGWQSSFL